MPIEVDIETYLKLMEEELTNVGRQDLMAPVRANPERPFVEINDLAVIEAAWKRIRERLESQE